MIFNSQIRKVGSGGGGSDFPPQAVTGISAKVGHNKVGLCFDDPADLVYQDYEIYEWAGTRVVRKVGSAPATQTDGTVIANSTTRDAYVSTPLVDTGLTDGTTYYYGMFPYSKTGAFRTDSTQVISATPSALGVGSPSGLAAKVGHNKVSLTWADPADVADTTSRYGTDWASTKLVRKAGGVPASASDGTLLVTCSTRDTYASNGYVDSTAVDGTGYYYALFAESTDGVASNVVAVAATPSALAAGSVSNLAISGGNGQASITWTDPSDIADTSSRFGANWASTVLVRKAGSAPSGPSDGTVVLTETTKNTYSSSAYVDSGLTNGTTYYYAAYAYSSDGAVSTAATDSVTPTAFDPSSVTWANSSWSEIAAAIAAHRAGTVNLANYWHVGDVREVSFTLYKATVNDNSNTSGLEPGSSSYPGKWYNGSTSAWEDVGNGVTLTTHWAIVDVNDGSSSATAGYAVSGSSAPAFIIQQVECLNSCRFNYSNSNTGGWDSSALRKYLNGSYLVSGISGYFDGLPSELQALLLPASVLAASGSSTSTTTSTDKLFLPAEKEVFGSNTYANSTAETSLKQWDYYATSANRVKNRLGTPNNGSANTWWERSPRDGNTQRFCRVISDGTATSYTASGSIGLAPCGCI